MGKYLKCSRCQGIGEVSNLKTGSNHAIITCPECNGTGNSSTLNTNYSPPQKTEGCYIATMVYEDYNHPKVLELRSFRDNFLNKNYVGRNFIKLYYLYSPKVVKRLENKKNVTKIIKKILDKFIYLIENKYE